MALSFFLNSCESAELTAEQLLEAFYDSGRAIYIDKLFALHGTDLYHFLLQQADKQLAEDISQQCWLKIIDNRLYFRGDSSFKTWLFAIGRYSLIDELRRKKRMPVPQALEDVLPDSTAPDLQLQQQHRQQQLGAALQALPFFQREALMLQLEGFSLAQIAQITAEAEETVKSRLRYARQRLQSQVGGCDDNT